MQCSRSCEARWGCVECRRGEGCYEESSLQCLQEKVYVERRSYAGGRRAASTGQQGADWQESSCWLGGRRHAVASFSFVRLRSSARQTSLRPIFACHRRHRRPLHYSPPCVRECSHALLVSLRPVDLLRSGTDHSGQRHDLRRRRADVSALSTAASPLFAPLLFTSRHPRCALRRLPSH